MEQTDEAIAIRDMIRATAASHRRCVPSQLLQGGSLPAPCTHSAAVSATTPNYPDFHNQSNYPIDD